MSKYAKTKKDYESQRAGSRTRNWWVVAYPEDLPDDWIDKFKSLQCKLAISPLHDKDFNANGEAKKPHHHVIMMFDTVKTFGQVKTAVEQLFGVNENGSICGIANMLEHEIMVKDRSGAVRYLAHLDNPEKFQYNVEDIQCFNGADLLEILQHNITENQEIIGQMQDYIIENEITEYFAFADYCYHNNLTWHNQLTNKSSLHFSRFISSFRNTKLKNSMKIDEETGEVIG